MSRAGSKRLNISRPKTVLVISQDTGGVLTYLRQRLQYNAPVGEVAVNVIGSGGSSKTMLSEARHALSGGRGDIPEADHVALVFDKDNDTHFKGVLDTVGNIKGVSAFVSVPCFEYFFILHYGVKRSGFSGPTDVLSALKTLDDFSRYSKSGAAVPVLSLKAREADALANAKAARTACSADGTLVPWTNVDELFSFIEVARTKGISAAVDVPLSRWAAS